MKSLIVFSLLISGFFTLQANADSWDALVEKLTQSRVEVESLSKEIDSLQKEKQADVEQWSQRKIELEAQVQKEKLRSLQISEKVKKNESRVRLQGKTDPSAQKRLLAWIERYENWVESSIPFLHESRRQTLMSLRSRAQKSQEPVEFILADFWAFVEAEMKLAQTNEYKIVDIELAGKSKKCEVARIGLHSLFVVTPDGKMFKAQKDANTWSWKDIDSPEDREGVLMLVKNLKNKNGSGYYQLPIEGQHVGASL